MPKQCQIDTGPTLFPRFRVEVDNQNHPIIVEPEFGLCYYHTPGQHQVYVKLPTHHQVYWQYHFFIAWIFFVVYLLITYGQTQSPFEEIKRQSSIGVIFLTLRNFSIQAVATIGFFILTIVLGTAEVGLFAIVTEVVGIFGYFSSWSGPSDSKKIRVTQKDLRSSFISSKF
jgi:hypothetical protein